MIGKTWSNVAARAKEDVVLDVLVKEQTGGTLNSAVATAKKKKDKLVHYCAFDVLVTK